MTVSVDQFLRWHYEMSINKQMLSRAYVFDRESVLGYVFGVLALKIPEILDALQCDTDIAIVTEDIFQFSSTHDVTDRLCKRLINAGDPVVDAPALGKILLGTRPRRNVVAYRKYGENHGKMAARLGLVQTIEKHYMLSCLGQIFVSLNAEDRRRLIVRLLLRTPLVAHLLHLSDGDIDMRKVMSELSDTTYLRRRSSVRNMLAFLRQSTEYDFSRFLNRLIFL